MFACRFLVVSTIAICGIQAKSLENRTELEWVKAGQNAIWETSQVFHRTVIGLSSQDLKQSPKFIQSLSKNSAKLAGIFGVAGAFT